ncbi:MAG: tripartite tricarboxylate transporter substrate binding protein [Candidatus Binatia bacterium]
MPHSAVRSIIEQQRLLAASPGTTASEADGIVKRCSNAAATRRRWRVMLTGMVGLILGGSCGSSIAQDYPTRPIRILVGFSAGSTTDILARTVGQKMNEAWGQPVLVDNRPSAGAIVASSAVATAAPDGYTLLVVSAGHAATAAMSTRLPYDTLKDFAGVSLIANVPSILVVSPALGVRSVKDLVALAKSKPGQLNFSSPGVGSANHLAGELFKTLAGIQAVHVPYKGIPEAMTAVVAGSVQFNFSPVVNVLSLTRDGKLLALGASTGKRSAALPDVPTVAEAGVPGYVFDPWFGILAPAKTPQPLLAKLSGEIARIVELPDVRERLHALGADPAPTTPEGFDAYVRSEVAKFEKIVRDAGIKPE